MAARKKANNSNIYIKDPELFKHLQSVSEDVDGWSPEKRMAAYDYIRSRYVRGQPSTKKQES